MRLPHDAPLALARAFGFDTGHGSVVNHVAAADGAAADADGAPDSDAPAHSHSEPGDAHSDADRRRRDASPGLRQRLDLTVAWVASVDNGVRDDR